MTTTLVSYARALLTPAPLEERKDHGTARLGQTQTTAVHGDATRGASVDVSKPKARTVEHNQRTSRSRCTHCNLKDQLDAAEDKNRTLTKEAEQMRREKGSLYDDLKLASGEVHVLRKDVQAKEARMAELEQLLELKTSELQNMKALLPGTDSIAVSEVVRLVRSLNGEMFQTSALVAESLEAIPRTKIVSKEASSQPMTQLLRFFDDKEEFWTFVQYAIQDCLVSCGQKLIDTWGMNELQGKLLQEIYERVKKEEAPSMSMRWRATTRKAIKYQKHQKLEPSNIIRWMWSCISQTLQPCGWSADAYEQVQPRVLQRFQDICGRILELDRIMGTSVVSRELHIFSAKPGQDYTDSWMDISLEDVGRKGDSPQTGRVLVTSDLGLLGREAVGMESKEVIYLKTKVLLDTMVMVEGAR